MPKNLAVSEISINFAAENRFIHPLGGFMIESL